MSALARRVEAVRRRGARARASAHRHARGGLADRPPAQRTRRARDPARLRSVEGRLAQFRRRPRFVPARRPRGAASRASAAAIAPAHRSRRGGACGAARRRPTRCATKSLALSLRLDQMRREQSEQTRAAALRCAGAARRDRGDVAQPRRSRAAQRRRRAGRRDARSERARRFDARQRRARDAGRAGRGAGRSGPGRSARARSASRRAGARTRDSRHRRQGRRHRAGRRSIPRRSSASARRPRKSATFWPRPRCGRCRSNGWKSRSAISPTASNGWPRVRPRRPNRRGSSRCSPTRARRSSVRRPRRPCRRSSAGSNSSLSGWIRRCSGRNRRPASNSRAIEDLARRIDGVRASIERQNGSQPDAAKLEAALRDISHKLDRPAAPGADPEALAAMFQDLAARIDQRASPTIDIKPIEQALRSLGDRPVEIDTTPIENMMRDLGARLAAPTAPDLRPLEESAARNQPEAGSRRDFRDTARRNRSDDPRPRRTHRPAGRSADRHPPAGRGVARAQRSNSISARPRKSTRNSSSRPPTSSPSGCGVATGRASTPMRSRSRFPKSTIVSTLCSRTLRRSARSISA